METLIAALLLHAATYPAMKPIDAVKLTFQNEYGGGHLIHDPEMAYQYLCREYESTPHDSNAKLLEPVGNGLLRVHLAAWEEDLHPLEELFDVFLRSAKMQCGTEQSFLSKIETLKKLTAEKLMPFSSDELMDFLEVFPLSRENIPSHSEDYRNAYHPAYRIVRRDLAAAWLPRRTLFQKRVYAFLKTIPERNVCTYGQIAEALGGVGLSRAVGNALHGNPDLVEWPCYKVVNADGKLSARYGFGGDVMQESLLRAIGVEVYEKKVDLNRFGMHTDGSSNEDDFPGKNRDRQRSSRKKIRKKVSCMASRVFPATDLALNDALAFVEERLKMVDCPMKASMQIAVCVEEMFVNVAHYAYGSEQGNVTLNVECTDSAATIELIDEGMAFDPLAKPDPDTTLSVEERNIGGLGIFMVKKTMNEVHYERIDGKNVFVMKKYFT